MELDLDMCSGAPGRLSSSLISWKISIPELHAHTATVALKKDGAAMYLAIRSSYVRRLGSSY